MNSQELKHIALQAINKIYRNDPWVRELYQSVGIQLENIDEMLNELLNNGFFDAVMNKGLKVYEKDLGITGTGTLEDRRALVQIMWNNSGKCTLEKIRAIVKTFVLDDVEVKFEDGLLKLEFNNSEFVYAIHKIREHLTIVKPAHIGIVIEDAHLVEGELLAGSYVTTTSIVTIERSTESNTEIDDSRIWALVHINQSHIIHDIRA